MENVTKVVERSIGDEFPEQFGAILDGWTRGSEHYHAVHACYDWNGVRHCPLLSMAPIINGPDDRLHAEYHMPALASFLPFFVDGRTACRLWQAIGSIWPSAFLGSLRGGAGAGAVVQEAPVNDQRSCETEFTMTRDWNKDMTFLESAHATVIPFGFDETCHALSTALLTSSSGMSTVTGSYPRTQEPSSELGNSATLVLHSVTRRYVEADRVVFVSRSLTEGQDESAWIVLRRVTEGSDMVLETYTRLMPVGFKLTSEIDARGNKFLKVFDKVDEGDVSNSMVMFERMLLDERQTICL
ncbi:hypothetical protein GQ600_2005 [Phytophthora cactorum]|nr:hypothetical protein GQ600_2005 [Phytophthora cactorum]